MAAATLEEIVETFSTKTSNLKRCMEMRLAADSPACMSDLKAIDKEVTSLEQGLREFREHLDEKRKSIARARALSAISSEYLEWLEHASKNLPAHLPTTSGKENKREMTHVKSNGAQPTKKKMKSTKSSGEVDFTRMEYLTVDQFDGIPKYIKNRITYDQVNNAIDEIHKVLASKYRILSLPRSSMGESVMKKYKAFKEAECKGTEGSYFFIDDDIKTYSNMKMDSKGRGILTILRHCGRVKEARDGGLVRYAVSC